eukprot:scaffold1928_cov109-Alexandrium_tamarense.AAC.66
MGERSETSTTQNLRRMSNSICRERQSLITAFFHPSDQLARTFPAALTLMSADMKRPLSVDMMPLQRPSQTATSNPPPDCINHHELRAANTIQCPKKVRVVGLLSTNATVRRALTSPPGRVRTEIVESTDWSTSIPSATCAACLYSGVKAGCHSILVPSHL